MHGPLHIGAEAVAESRILGQPGVVGGQHEALYKAIAEVGFGALAGMDTEHGRVAATGFGELWRTAEHLGPVAGQPLDVLRVPWVRERVIQHWVGETPFVVCGGEG